jgi:ATP-dependent protease ClpP protease subunit
MHLKKLFVTALIILSAITFGCAGGGQVMDRQPVNHELDIMIHAASDNVVTIDPLGLNYEKSNNPYLRPSGVMLINRAEDKAFMSIYSGLSVSDVRNLWQDIMYLNEETNIKRVILFLNSGGGGAFAGLALADLIMRAQSDYGIMFEANASGIIASAAVPPFAVSDHRIAAPGTIFMVHEAALWKWPGRESASDIRAQNELMILLQDRYLKYLVPRSKLSLEKWEAMEKATTWFSAEKALNVIGIVDEIK